MLIRMLVWVLLIGASCANAAPPQKHPPAVAPTSTPPAPADIDVDAMARAKDVGGPNAEATSTPPAQAEGSAAQPTQAQPSSADAGDAAAGQPTQTGSPAAPTEDQPPAPAPANEADDAAQIPLSPLAPAPATDPAGKRLAASCEARATSLLDAAQNGDYATATKDFDAKMRSGLPPEKFRKAWESLAQFGKLTARGQPHPATLEGYIAITIPLIFEKKNLYAQVACGSDGRVAGFYVKPLNVPAQ